MTSTPGGRPFGPLITIGRDQTSHIVVPDPLASLRHAYVEGVNGTAVLRDLGSFRGTFVDGRRITGPTPLARGADVTIGNHTYRWDGAQLAPAPRGQHLGLRAEGLTVAIKGGRRLIDGVSLAIGSGSLTAVIGPSGAGKSTLLGALTGLRPATSGRVLWRGQDLYAHYDQLRFEIGLVPQQDIQHHQLRVRQALEYSAALRLPPDTTPVEQTARVAAVADQLQLTSRLENRIGTELSGGQKKRVSIATELLTAPPLLFLDEPTSGLDPGLEVEIMRQLRGLADDGRTVVLVTHSVLALDTCDNVAVLAPGGVLAYFGPPAGLLAHFRVRSHPEVFSVLERPDLWSLIPFPSGQPPMPPADQQPVPQSEAAPIATGGSGVVRPSRALVMSQLKTLIHRNVAVVASDRLLLAMLILLPLVMGVLSRVVPGSAGMSLINAPLAPGGFLNSEEAAKRLTLLIVSAALIGTAMTIRELVAERPIFRREYAVGLFPDLYLASKILVFGAIAFAQGVVVTALATIGLAGPDTGGAIGLGRLELAVTIGSLSFAMATVGLLLSAIITSTEQTMPALVAVVMLQLVLSGALFDVAGRAGLEQLSWLAPGRWGYAAAASTVAIQRPLGEQGRKRDWIANAGGSHLMMDLAILALLCLVTVVLAVIAVRRSATER